MSDIHQKFFNLYLMQLDGMSLNPDQLTLLQTHLANCALCRANQRIYQNLGAQAIKDWPAVTAPIRTDQILRAAQNHSRLKWVTQPLRGLMWAGFAVLMLVLILFIFTSLRPLPVVQPVSSPTPVPPTPENTPTAAMPTDIERPATPEPLIFNSPTSEIDTYTNFKKEGCHFGGAVDIEADLMVAGAPCWGNPPGFGAGAAYVLRKSPGGELAIEATLTASDRDDGIQKDQNFGMSVVLNGTMIAIGAPGYDDPQVGDDTGAIYLYEYDGQGWLEKGKLLADHRKPGARLGTIIAFDGNLLATSGSPEAGSVVSFRRDGKGDWRELAQVPVEPSADGEPYNVMIDLYGHTLAFSTVIQNSQYKESDPNTYLASGIVTLYDQVGDGWEKIYQTEPQEVWLYRMVETLYGIPVAIGGEAGNATWLAVGKPGFAGSGRETGSVAIFERGESGWKPQSELVLAYGEPVSGALAFFGHDPGPIFFGSFVEIEGNRLAVISIFANTAYIFERDGKDWEYRYRLIPGKAEGTYDDFQRRTIAISGNDLLMGSPGELAGGELYLFYLQP